MDIKKKIRIAINIALVIMVVLAWVEMIRGAIGPLAYRGLENLKLFTVLSNLFVMAASVVWLVMTFKDPRGEVSKGSKQARAEVIKYISTVAVMVTFATVMLFLGPWVGYGLMFNGSNLYFHLLVPVIALLEELFLGEANKIGKRENMLAVLPTLLYAIFYLGNIMINGKGEWPDTNDWYGFLTWGPGIGAVIFCIMLLATWALGLLIRKLSADIQK